MAKGQLFKVLYLHHMPKAEPEVLQRRLAPPGHIPSLACQTAMRFDPLRGVESRLRQIDLDLTALFEVLRLLGLKVGLSLSELLDVAHFAGNTWNGSECALGGVKLFGPGA